MRSTGTSARGAIVLLLIAGVLISGCFGAAKSKKSSGPKRYRDEVFGAVNVQHDLVYGSAPRAQGGTEALALDLYEPAGDGAASRAALVYVHGGGFVGGDKAWGFDIDYATRFARHGYITVSINYRLDVNSGRPMEDKALDAQHDAQAAVRWLRANQSWLRVDPDRIVIVGPSAGAMTALQVAYNADDPGSSGNPGFPSDVAAASSIVGCLYFGAGMIDAGEPPVHLVNGTADPVIPYSCAEATHFSARAVGNHSRLTAWPGGTHDIWAQVGRMVDLVAPALSRNMNR